MSNDLSPIPTPAHQSTPGASSPRAAPHSETISGSQPCDGLPLRADPRSTQHPAFYLIESRWKRQSFIHETDLAVADLDTVAKDIADGQYDTGEIAAIYRCLPASRIMEDDTLAVLEQVALHLNRTETVPCETLARLLWQNGIGYARRLEEAE